MILLIALTICGVCVHFWAKANPPVFEPPKTYFVEHNSYQWVDVGYSFVDSGYINHPMGRVNYGRWTHQYQVKAPLAHVISKFETYCPEPDWSREKTANLWKATCYIPTSGSPWMLGLKLGATKTIQILPGKYAQDQLEKALPGTEESWTTIYFSTSEPNLPEIYTRKYRESIAE